MKRNFAVILLALAAAAVFGGVVYAVLVAARISEPATVTVHGLTPRRLWATAVVMLALAGVLAGWLALARPARRPSTGCWRFRITAALVAGLVSVIHGV